MSKLFFLCKYTIFQIIIIILLKLMYVMYFYMKEMGKQIITEIIIQIKLKMILNF